MSEATRATREPKSSRFTQQKLCAFRPVLTPTKVVLAYLALGVVLIPLGAFCLSASHDVKELSLRYDNHEGCEPEGDTKEKKVLSMQNQNTEEQLQCDLSIELSKDLSAPIYFYYELEDYYQNHRRYVKSRNDHQLAGRSGGENSDCRPKLYQHSEREDEDPARLIKPCGLTAWSYFNDTFEVTKIDGTLDMVEEGIAWKSDRLDLFGSYHTDNFNNIEAYRGGASIKGPVNEDEHFMVWMRVAALPRFRKLYGILYEDLKSGDKLTIAIKNNYNTYLFGGKKRVVLSTTSWLGGRNSFLGTIYIVAGCVSVFMGIVYFTFHIQFPRHLGDERFLSWKRKDWE